MKKKKIIGGILSVLMTVSLLSIAVKAQTIGYSMQMPKTGYIDSGSANKADTEGTAYNTVDYLGWVGSGDYFKWWVINPNGTQLTDSQTFCDEGRFTTPYKGNNGGYYVGWSLKLRMKTGPVTYHACDVNGRFTP